MGSLIVFEGTDGSGKATQSKLLLSRLQSEGVDCQALTFLRYGEPSAAAVELYLSGKLGENPGDVNAYAASTFYAVDRFCSYRQSWGEFYQRGGVLIADQYTTSNAVYQASKLPPEERRGFLDWLFDFEYRLMGLPEPTAVFYLDVPTDLTEHMMRSREAATATSADIHEHDDAYLRAYRAVGRQLVADYGWQYVNCLQDGQTRRMRSIEDIHEELYRRVCGLLQ